MPVQSYIAGVFFHGDAHYLDFFTRLTDFSGYDGAFTPGHLWFIAYLFVISQLCLKLLVLHKARTRDKTATSLPFIVIVLLGFLPVLTQPVLNIGGKSFGEYLTYFLLGYFILADEQVLVTLDKQRFWLIGLFAGATVATISFAHGFQQAVSWLGVLALLGLARHYWNTSGPLTKYLSQASFGLYLSSVLDRHCGVLRFSGDHRAGAPDSPDLACQCHSDFHHL